MRNKDITLAIETAVAGGSLALFCDDELIRPQAGHSDVSRAEALLANIIRLLNDACVAKTDISRVAVSLGPGSFTGLRIGIATALGLKAGLGVPCVGVSVLEAAARNKNRPGIIALPAGKGDVVWQEFGGKMMSPMSDSASLFLDFLKTHRQTAIYAHSLLIEHVQNETPGRPIYDIGTDLAAMIGRAVRAGFGSEDLKPIYLRTSRYTGVG